MLKNRNVIKAIKRRLIPMEVERAVTALNKVTGRHEVQTLPPVLGKGCFQQLNRKSSDSADDLMLLSEGERTEATTVLWTQAELKAGDQDSLSVSDKIIELRTGRRFKVLLVRDKFYGNFNRAILAKVRDE